MAQRPEERIQPVRPLRRDAERNRQRILKAASEVFTERGLDVSLDEVARHAGVGVGTVYRRFRTKEDLVEALFVDRIEEVAALAEKATHASDPWSGLTGFMQEAATMLAGDLGLRQMMMFATYGGDKVRYARERNQTARQLSTRPNLRLCSRATSPLTCRNGGGSPAKCIH